MVHCFKFQHTSYYVLSYKHWKMLEKHGKLENEWRIKHVDWVGGIWWWSRHVQYKADFVNIMTKVMMLKWERGTEKRRRGARCLWFVCVFSTFYFQTHGLKPTQPTLTHHWSHLSHSSTVCAHFGVPLMFAFNAGNVKIVNMSQYLRKLLSRGLIKGKWNFCAMTSIKGRTFYWRFHQNYVIRKA